MTKNSLTMLGIQVQPDQQHLVLVDGSTSSDMNRLYQYRYIVVDPDPFGLGTFSWIRNYCSRSVSS